MLSLKRVLTLRIFRLGLNAGPLDLVELVEEKIFYLGREMPVRGMSD